MLPKDCLLLRNPLGHSLNVSPSVCHTIEAHLLFYPKNNNFYLELSSPVSSYLYKLSGDSSANSIVGSHSSKGFATVVLPSVARPRNANCTSWN